MNTAAIIQPSFLPWKGYFDIIHDVDVFVFLDDVQYTSRDWRNRNRIKTPGGIRWISVPVLGGSRQAIADVRINYSGDWVQKHKRTIHHSYASARHYKDYCDGILSIYDKRFELLSDFDIHATKAISSILGIKTEFVNSSELGCDGKKDDRLIGICKAVGADRYISGPSAKDYIVGKKFDDAGIALEYKDYSGYPEYPQLWGGFSHEVSVIDLIFNLGKEAPQYIWGWRDL